MSTEAESVRCSATGLYDPCGRERVCQNQSAVWGSALCMASPVSPKGPVSRSLHPGRILAATDKS